MMETLIWTVRTHFMRLILILLFSAVSAYSQLISFGAKVGVPLTDFVNAASGNTSGGFINYAQTTNRYIFGATGELHLPFGFGVEVDALYRHFSYQSNQQAVDVVTAANTKGNAWEFPLLAKYRFGKKVVRPFVDAGVAWDTLQGLTQTVTNTVVSGNHTSTTSGSPSQLENNTTRGYVTGAGLDIHILLLHIIPEVRYTRWADKHFFDTSGFLNSNRNQAEFLLGITF